MIPFHSFQCHFQTVLLIFHFIPLFCNIQTRFLNSIPLMIIPFHSFINSQTDLYYHLFMTFHTSLSLPKTSYMFSLLLDYRWFWGNTMYYVDCWTPSQIGYLSCCKDSLWPIFFFFSSLAYFINSALHWIEEFSM